MFNVAARRRRRANTAVPVKAENNWWGLRPARSPAANTGPAISPTTNPPIPENPVNGAAVADGTGTTSDAVDFFPFRNGFQSDPNTGEFAVFDVPGLVNDTAPTVTLDDRRGHLPPRRQGRR